MPKAEIVGDRTNILVEKGELGCAFKYLLVSIRGTDVSTWDFQGDCRTQPIITINGAEQQFEFVIGNQLVSYVNRDDRFLRRARPIVRPPLATPTPAPAFSATPAAAETRSNNRKSARAAGPVQRPAAPGPSRMQAPPAAPVLEFPALEQKPVRIILDK